MRVSRFVTPALAGVLVLCSVPVATAQPPPDERRSGWYVGGGAGVNWASDINQRGSNRDHLCYPRYACFDEKPRPEQSGYRWAYDLRTAVGAPFELSTGFDFERLRLELAFAQRVNGIEQVFRKRQRLHGESPRPSARRHGHVGFRVLDRQPHRPHAGGQRVLRLPKGLRPVRALRRRRAWAGIRRAPRIALRATLLGSGEQ